jgi:hypothetical protein
LSLQVPERRPQRDSLVSAGVVAFAVHALVVIGLWKAGPLESHAGQAPQVVQLVLAPETQPQQFTELPANRRDDPPAKPELLSNVTSRARDLQPKADAAMPKSQGESNEPAVPLDPSSGHMPSSDPATQPAPATSDPALQPSQQAPHSSSGADSRSDIHQSGMDDPSDAAGLQGNISLNTTAWDYAPWLQRFGRKLMHRWIPPMAYSIGLLKEGGYGEFEVEISKSGELLRLQPLSEGGHPSLAQAAEGALRNMPPFEALPKDFPEPTLILRVRMIYPKILPRR